MNDFKITDGVLEKYFGCEKNIVIPDNVKVIGKDCFAGLEFIESVTIPESVIEIQENAFYGCSNFKNINFALKGNLEIIGESAFGCCNINELVFPSSLRQIHRQAFCPVSNLKKLVLNDGLQYIGTCAFEGCEDLPEVFIPASVTRIDRLAFAYVSRMIAYAEAPSKPVGWAEDWNCDEFPCRVFWGSQKAKNANEEQSQTQELKKTEDKKLESNKTISNENQPAKKKSKLNKSTITYIVILAIGFLTTLILSILGLNNSEGSFIVPLIICSIVEVIIGIAMYATAKKQIYVVCPECGTKRECHREFLYTEEKDQRTTSGGNVYYSTTYIHHYRDTYTCPNCGMEQEVEATGSGGKYLVKPDGGIQDTRKPPKEF